MKVFCYILQVLIFTTVGFGSLSTFRSYASRCQ